MATFARSSFGHAGYAAARPSYSQALYNLIFAYHKGRYDHCVDLGTGHGVVARALASRFERVTGIDPSAGMHSQANSLTPKSQYPNIEYVVGPAESTSTNVGENTVDMIVSAQAAHWFDYPRLWPNLAASLKKGGTIAFWGYAELHLPKHEEINNIILRYMLGNPNGDGSEDSLGPYWPQPGASICTGLYHDIVPPSDAFEDVQRFEYRPTFDASGKSDFPPWAIRLTAKVRDLQIWMRSWSAYQEWQEANPTRRPRHEQSGPSKGEGDIVDSLFDEIKQVDPEWQDLEKEVPVELPTGLLLARKK